MRHVIPQTSFSASWSLPVSYPTTADLVVFLPKIDLSLAHGFGVPLGLSATPDLESANLLCALSPLTLGTAVSTSPFRPFQSQVLWAVRAFLTAHTGATAVPQVAHGVKDPLVRGS